MSNQAFFDDIVDPVTVALRPLVKGMNTVSPSMTLEDGAFFDLQGLEVVDRGLVRRETWQPILDYPVPFLFDNEYVEEYEMFFNSVGARKAVVITNRALYEVRVGDGIYPILHGRAYAQSVQASVPTITGHSFVTDGVKVGDYLRVVTGGVTYVLPITTVAATTLAVTGGPAIYTQGLTLEVIRTFDRADGFVDYTVALGRLLVVDGSTKGITAYDTTYTSNYVPYHLVDSVETQTFLGAQSITYFGGMVFCLGIIETDGTHRQRVRWSTATDPREFLDLSWMDLTDCQGSALRLSAMGTLLFIYMTDAVYYGRPANLSGLPYAFTKLETGGISAVGMKAMTPHSDGQFFVGRDDIYFVSASTGLTSLGSVINRTSVRHNRNLKMTYLKVDVLRNKLIMGLVPAGGRHFDELYYFNLRTKAWSRDLLQYGRNFSGLSIACNFDPVTWSEATGTWAAASGSWLSLRSETSERLCVAFDVQGHLYTLTPNRNNDRYVISVGVLETLPIRVLIETGDFDFDAPDENKSWYRVGLKITDLGLRSADIVYRVWGSIDRGRSWKSLGIMRISADDDEDDIAFRMTGSLARFRFESVSFVPEYEINEITMRVSGRGPERQRSAGYR